MFFKKNDNATARIIVSNIDEVAKQRKLDLVRKTLLIPPNDTVTKRQETEVDQMLEELGKGYKVCQFMQDHVPSEGTQTTKFVIAPLIDEQDKTPIRVFTMHEFLRDYIGNEEHTALYEGMLAIKYADMAAGVLTTSYMQKHFMTELPDAIADKLRAMVIAKRDEEFDPPAASLVLFSGKGSHPKQQQRAARS